jgi:hypothetical protein
LDAFQAAASWAERRPNRGDDGRDDGGRGWGANGYQKDSASSPPPPPPPSDAKSEALDEVIARGILKLGGVSIRFGLMVVKVPIALLPIEQTPNPCSPFITFHPIYQSYDAAVAFTIFPARYRY